MGNSKTVPVLDKDSIGGCKPGFRWAATSMQGWPKYMEDRYHVLFTIPKPSHLHHWRYFSIFDGHAGSQTAERCSRELFGIIEKNVGQLLVDQDNEDAKHHHVGIDVLSEQIRKSFLEMDQKLKNESKKVDDFHHHTDEDISGSTAVVVLMSKEHIFTAHLGDSRAILMLNDDELVATTDHKPTANGEAQRIIDAGSNVYHSRVNGYLAVSRAFGDFSMKNNKNLPPEKQAVSCEPEIKIFSIKDGLPKLLIMACDGVFDAMTNEEVTHYTQFLLKHNKDVKCVVENLVETCLYKGSVDNLSAIVVEFNDSFAYDEKMDNEEKERDKDIAKIVENMMNNADPRISSVNELMERLKYSVDEETLPPGGGLESKRNVVIEVFENFKPKH